MRDKDSICKSEGCYMFEEGSDERVKCERKCKLASDRLLSYANSIEPIVKIIHYTPET